MEDLFKKLNSNSNWKVWINPMLIKENVNTFYDEDIIQVSHLTKNIILDIGYYDTSYCLYFVTNNDWSNPLVIEKKDLQSIITIIINIMNCI
jgi:hypothetical protein